METALFCLQGSRRPVRNFEVYKRLIFASLEMSGSSTCRVKAGGSSGSIKDLVHKRTLEAAFQVLNTEFVYHFAFVRSSVKWALGLGCSASFLNEETQTTQTLQYFSMTHPRQASQHRRYHYSRHSPISLQALCCPHSCSLPSIRRVTSIFAGSDNPDH